ncbi:disease resistance protein At4g27190-like [Solanum tuberosum]|uniref:Cc-nbs-lrr resistance protein n=1 Tax=Solanum tuberosum TaxID=4113 RepID=M0ZQH1_SOLTU|nr:PREDICTED: disease resistance protein At4g27190-like [Solanum tuberosum]
MEILINVVGGFVVEVGKFVCKCIYPKIENIVRFSSKVENLREEMEKITKLRDDIKGKTEKAKGEGYKPKPDVIKWIEDVCELEDEWETMQENIATAKTRKYTCCPNCSLRSEVCTQVQNIRDQLCRLKEVGENFGSNLMVENYQVKKVEFIPGPSIEGQSAATRNLNKILRLLEDDKVGIIGVWGAGGIGKTTLVKNLNNELKQIDVSIRSKLSFGVVIWVTVPKPPIDIRKVQAQIADRLSLEVNTDQGSEERNASKVYQRLKQEKSFLVILDDVWEAIDLDHVGVPQPKDHAGSKVIITSRFLDVCNQMEIDIEMKVYTLDENESWALFIKNVGDVANWPVDIQPVAMEIARECDGLPLAITVIGASMRGKNMAEQWKDALESLRKSEPNATYVRDKVYKVIKWSVDSLEQRGNRSDIKSCFLYCSLYPASIPTNDLIHCWWAEGFLGEHDTYEKAYNRGITIIEDLKNVCLLEEAHEKDCVKMHDVVRDVAIWIDKSISHNVKRMSFISNKIKHLTDNLTEYPETTTLLLQDNYSLREIPHEFFLSFPALRVVNLSETGIRALPCSIRSLCQLRTLILQRCRMLNELPAIGNLCNLQLLDCDRTELCCLPEGMDKLTNLRLLNMTLGRLKESIDLGVFHELQRLEMLQLRIRSGGVVGATSFDEISHLPNLTSLFIYLDSSSISISKSDQYTWMKRLKRFHITVGNTSTHDEVPFNKSTRAICLTGFDIFKSKVWLSSMLQFASDLYLEECMGLTEFIRNNSFDGLKSLYIFGCSYDFGPSIEGSGQFDDPMPNLEYLRFYSVDNLKSVSDFGHFLGLRFSKLRKLDISHCRNLTCLFNVGGAFSVPRHLEEITLSYCFKLTTELLAQCGSSQTTFVSSEIPRVRKLLLYSLNALRTFGEPESMWEHLEELEVISCNGIRKLPLSIQTSNKIKKIRGRSEWWSSLEWDDEKYKSNLENCFTNIL